MKERDFEEAAALCQKILGKSKELWEEHIECFAKQKQLMVSNSFNFLLFIISS
jgi:hypothetical protein